ncbi:MAG: hypothetical protein R6V02_09235 [Candidatus Aminicenantes bacterium]
MFYGKETSTFKTRAFEVFFFFFLVFLLCSLPGGGQTDPADKAFFFGGDFRIFASTSYYPDFQPIFPDSQQFMRSLLRFTAQGRLTSKLQYDFHLVQHLDYSSEKGGGIFNPPIGKQRYQFLRMPWEWLQSDNWSAGLFFDRFNIRLSLSWADFTLGRQAVTFGKTYFWNPIDVFLPFRVWDIDRDYKEGVDALRLDVPLGNFSGMSLIGAPGKEIVLTEDFTGTAAKKDVSWYGSALLARLYTISANWDLAFQTGKVYGGYHLGGAASGRAGLFDMRLEGAYFIADKNRRRPLPDPLQDELLDDHLTAAAGVGWKFPSSLVMEVEYFYNGAAGTKNPESALLRMIHGTNLHLSTSLVGIMFGYDILPLVKGKWIGILSVTDRSFYLHPNLSISLTNEMDLMLGAALSAGESPYLFAGKYPRLRTEFGTYPDVFYLLLKWYF